MVRFAPHSIVASSLLALLLASSGKATSLVANGGFESGDFTGWLTEPSSSGSNFGVATTDPHWGGYSAYFANFIAGNYDGISQTINSLSQQPYQLSFWLAINTETISPFVFAETSTNAVKAASPNSIDDFQVLWNGDVIEDFSTSKDSQYGEYTLSLPAGSTSGPNTLGFQAYNTGLGTFLDDISLNPISLNPADLAPEPGTLCLISLGLLGIGFAGLRRKAV